MAVKKKAATRKTPVKAKAKTKTKIKAKGKKAVRLLAGGNPQIAKGEGAAPVQAYIAALDGWKHDLAKRLDTLITKTVPKAQKAVKWNSPFYGVAGQGWFVSFHVFTKYIKVTFFKGAALKNPPTGGTSKDARWIDVREDDFNEPQLKAWIKQAAAMPGWMA